MHNIKLNQVQVQHFINLLVFDENITKTIESGEGYPIRITFDKDGFSSLLPNDHIPLLPKRTISILNKEVIGNIIDALMITSIEGEQGFWQYLLVQWDDEGKILLSPVKECQ